MPVALLIRSRDDYVGGFLVLALVGRRERERERNVATLAGPGPQAQVQFRLRLRPGESCHLPPTSIVDGLDMQGAIVGRNRYGDV